MVVGAVSLDEIFDALSPLEKSLRRPVKPTIYSLQDLKERIQSGNHFLRSLASSKEVFLIGDSNPGPSDGFLLTETSAAASLNSWPSALPR